MTDLRYVLADIRRENDRTFRVGIVEGREVRPLEVRSQRPQWPGDTSWVLTFAVEYKTGWKIEKAYYDDIKATRPYIVCPRGFRKSLP